MWYTSAYNALWSTWGMGWPNSLQPAPGEPPLSPEEWMTNLQAAGVGRLRIGLFGWNGPIGTSIPSFEPTVGTWNTWDGRLTEIVAAARTHGVGFQVVPFHNREFQIKGGGWGKHAWNAANGGFLDDPRDAFTDPRAIEAGKARIAAIYAVCGDTLLATELMGEMSNIVKPYYWFGHTDWSAMPPVIWDILVPWVEEMAQYAKTLSAAPVGNGQVFAPRGFDPDPGHPSNLRNEVFRTPSLNCAFINGYDEVPALDKFEWLRACQQYTGLPCFFEQYAPWDLKEAGKPPPPYTREPPDFSWSLPVEWLARCAEHGCVGPLRWPEIRPIGAPHEFWGIASPEMATIAGTANAFAQTVKADKWTERGTEWESKLAGSFQWTASRGDGQHLTAFIEWGAGPPDLTVHGLVDGEYSLRWWDWLSGKLIEQVSAESVGGTLVPGTIDAVEWHSALYLSPQETPTPSQRITLRVTPVSGPVQEIDLELGENYILDVREATP